MGMGKTGIPRGPMGFPREWKYDQPWNGSGMGMGIKSLKWERFGTQNLFRHISNS